MEIQQSDPPRIVREKLEVGFARAYGPGEEAPGRARRRGVPRLRPAGRTTTPLTPGSAHPAPERARPGHPGPRPLLRAARRDHPRRHPAGGPALGRQRVDAAARRRRPAVARLSRHGRRHDAAVPARGPSPLGDGLASTSGSPSRPSRDERADPVQALLQRVDVLPTASSSTWSSGPARATRSTWRSSSAGWSTPGSSCLTTPTGVWSATLVGAVAVPPSLKGLLQARLDALGRSGTGGPATRFGRRAGLLGRRGDAP